MNKYLRPCWAGKTEESPGVFSSRVCTPRRQVVTCSFWPLARSARGTQGGPSGPLGGWGALRAPSLLWHRGQGTEVHGRKAQGPGPQGTKAKVPRSEGLQAATFKAQGPKASRPRYRGPRGYRNMKNPRPKVPRHEGQGTEVPGYINKKQHPRSQDT